MSAPPSQTTLYPIPSSENDDEIDLRQVAGALGRHRRLITAISCASLVASGIYALPASPFGKGNPDCS